MTAQIKQAIELSAQLGGGTVYFWIRGTNNYAEARDLLLATAPGMFNSAPRSGYSLEQTDWLIWNGRVNYSAVTPVRPEEKTGRIYRAYDTSGGTVHISQSIYTTGSYCLPCINSRPSKWQWTGSAWTQVEAGHCEEGCTETSPPTVPPYGEPAYEVGDTAYGTIARTSGDPPKAPYTGGAINITKDGIEGADIPSAEVKWTLTLYLDEITERQRQDLEDIRQHVNLSWFENRPPGSVRFESAVINSQGRENTEIRMNFIYEPNLTDIQIGQITGIAKKGHEYLWVYYQDYADPVSKTLFKRPIYVYTEQVFYWSDFAIIEELIQQAESDLEEDGEEDTGEEEEEE